MAWQWRAAEWGGPDRWEFVEVPVPAPASGEVTIRVRAAGVNPADAKHVASPRAGSTLPVPIGYEVSGVITAIGPDTVTGSGPIEVGAEVVAFRIAGGYTTEVTVPAEKVFRKPAALSHPEAANLLLAGCTAAEMLSVTRAAAGETVLLHGASGAVGCAVLQLARHEGIRVIGTTGTTNEQRVRDFGGVPVAYGAGLIDRVRELGPVDAALDAIGTPEALETSLRLVSDRSRIVTIVDRQRALDDGFHFIAGALPESTAFRDAERSRLVELADRGELLVPVARTFPLAEAREATALVATGHPGGKVALIPDDSNPI